MRPDKREGRGHHSPADSKQQLHDDEAGSNLRLGCPCGCKTRMPWLDDPDCKRHRVRITDREKYDSTGLYVSGDRMLTLRQWRELLEAS